jgi:putative MATE family efflux protein
LEIVWTIPAAKIAAAMREKGSDDRQGAVVGLGGNLAGLSLPKQVLVLAMWPLFEQILAFFVGLTDLLIAGRMAGDVERVAILDAMGLAGYVSWFFNILQGAVATGVMALVARATGARDAPLANRGLGQGIWLGFLAGCASMAILWMGAPTLIRLIGLTPEAAFHAEKFLKVLAFSGPFSGTMFALNAALRGSGDTRTPFFAMVVVNVVNMAMSWLLVFGPGQWGGHGIEGIAWGTVMGWAAGLVFAAAMVGRWKSEILHWSREDLKPHWSTILRIVRVGVPQGLEIAGMWSIHAFGIHIIASLPVTGALGAHILAIRVEAMSFLPGFAVATAGATLAGQYLGAGSKEMAVKAVRFSWFTGTSMMAVMGMIFIVFRKELIAMMAPGSDLHQQLGAPLLIVCGLAQPFYGTCIILKNTMRGAGATGIVMRAAFSSMIFYRIGVLWMLAKFGPINLTLVWIVLAVDLTTQALIFARLHFKGKWLDARV